MLTDLKGGCEVLVISVSSSGRGSVNTTEDKNTPNRFSSPLVMRESLPIYYQCENQRHAHLIPAIVSLDK